jgi:hypothetical protein
MQLEEKLARLRKRKESLQYVAVNPSSSNPLQISATVGDAVGRDKDDNIMQVVVVELKVAPGTVIESIERGGSEKARDAEEDTLEFFVDEESARGHKRVRVGSDPTDLLKEQGPEEPVVSSTSKQPKQVVARSITSEEMLLSLSTSIVENDAPPPGLRSSISIDAGGGERYKFTDPDDMEMNPPGVGGSNVSLHHESLDSKRSHSRIPSANEADDSELPHSKRPFTRSRTAQGATGEEQAVESIRRKTKVTYSDDDGEIYHVTS